MVGDARSIGELDATRLLLSKRSTSLIYQQPFSGRLFHSQTPKLAKSSASDRDDLSDWLGNKPTIHRWMCQVSALQHQVPEDAAPRAPLGHCTPCPEDTRRGGCVCASYWWCWPWS